MSASAKSSGEGSEARTTPSAAGFASVAVIGLGVMGGSFARALRALPEPPQVIGYSPRAEEREAALAAGALDRAPEQAEEAVGRAELVVYAAPLGAILEMQLRHQSVWRPDAIVSDLSSLKVPALGQARVLGFASRYVSAHPMVGSEASGFHASSSGLYRDADVWLSDDGASPEVRERVERLWSALGARPAWIDAETHDRRMVEVSQLPQLLSNALAHHLERVGLSREDLGTGGRDMTRLAASSPGMWKDLIAHSAPLLAPALREVAAELDALAARLDAHEVAAVAELMARTRAWSSGARYEAVDGATAPDTSTPEETA